MQSRQLRLIAILATILLVLVAVIYWVEPPKEKEEPGTAVQVFNDLVKDNIQHLEIIRPGGDRVVFDKVEGTWRLVQPIDVVADANRVEDMLGRLVNLRAKPGFDVKDDGSRGMADFGLTDEQVIKVSFKVGDSNHSLAIGSDTPVGYSTYVQIDASPQVRVASGRFREDFLRTVDELRSHEVWKFEIAEVQRITWIPTPQGEEPPAETETTSTEEGGASAGSEWAANLPRELVKNTHGWWLGADGPRADREKVEAWLREAKDLRIQSFTPRIPPDDTLPSGELVIVVNGAEHRVKLFPPISDGVLARVPLLSEPVVLGTDVLKLSRREPASFLSTELVPVHRYSVSTIEMTLGDTSWSATRSETGWSDTRAYNVLDALTEVKVDRTTPIEGEAEGWGRIRLVEGESREEVVRLGPAREDGSHLGKEEFGGPPFVISSDVIERLLQAIKEENKGTSSSDPD